MTSKGLQNGGVFDGTKREKTQSFMDKITTKSAFSQI